MFKRYLTDNAKATSDLGESFARSLKDGDIVALYGGLGAGKTVFAKGIAKGLGIEEEVISPTFTLLKEYIGAIKLYHFDLYRIEDEEELEQIGFYDYLGEDGVCVIEWPENAANLNDCISVHITGSGSDTRTIEIEGS